MMAILAPAVSTQAVTAEELTTGLTPGVPTIDMPMGDGIGVWNEVQPDGTVTAGIVGHRDGIPPGGWVGAARMIWNPIGAASWGTYYTNGLYVAGNGQYVLPGETIVRTFGSDATPPPTVTTTTSTTLAPVTTLPGGITGVEAYVINSNGVRCHLTAEGYWDHSRSCVDSSRIQFGLCFVAPGRQIDMRGTSLGMRVVLDGAVMDSMSYPPAGVGLVSAPSCSGGYVTAWAFDGAERGRSYRIEAWGRVGAVDLIDTWTLVTPSPPPIVIDTTPPSVSPTSSATTTTTTPAPTTTPPTSTPPTSTTAVATTTVPAPTATVTPPITTVTTAPGPTTSTATLPTTTTLPTPAASTTTTTAPQDATLSALSVTDDAVGRVRALPAAPPDPGSATLPSSTTGDARRVSSGGVTVEVNTSYSADRQDTEDTVEATANDATLEVVARQDLEVATTGFAPDSEVEIWLHSEPVLLGRVRADAAGTLRANIQIPADAPEGDHRLVVTGRSPAGDTISVAMAVRVKPPITPGLTSVVQTPSTATLGTPMIAGLLVLGTLASIIVGTRRRTRRAASQPSW